MEYTFNSTDPDKYDEIICPINYTGASNQIKWYVSFVNGKSNTVILDTDDYFIIDDIKYNVQRTHTNLDNIVEILTEIFNQAGISINIDNSKRITLYKDESFTMTDMSNRLKYATGFHYLKTIDLSSTIGYIGEEEKHIIKSKAVYFEYLTPIWYVISNLGTPNQISSMIETYKSYYPAVAVKMINTFSEGQALSVSNGDYQTVSRASSLNNLKLNIVDGNLQPIKFLSPIYITVSVEEAPIDESIEEAMKQLPSNQEYIQQLKLKLEENNNKIIELISKIEKGVSVEPQYTPFEEKKQENQPKETNKVSNDILPAITDFVVGQNQETPETLKEVDINKDDDTTESKEEGMVESQENNVKEESLKIVEEQENK